MGGCAAVVVSGNDFQRVRKAGKGNEKGFQVMVAVIAAPEDMETEVKFDVRAGDHIRKDTNYSTVMEVKQPLKGIGTAVPSCQRHPGAPSCPLRANRSFPSRRRAQRPEARKPSVAMSI